MQDYLERVTKSDVKSMYETLWLLEGSEIEKIETNQGRSTKTFSQDFEENSEQNFKDFFTDDFCTHQESLKISSSQLALKVIEILKKLVEIENANALGQTDQNSVTLCCLHFSLDTLMQLHDQLIFSENDQTVIKLNLMGLTFLCFNNLVNRDGKAIEPMFRKLFHLLEISDSNEISCGLILNILTILGNLCVKKSQQKVENLNLFLLCRHLVMKRLEILSLDRELLDIVQMLLIKIIRNVRKSREILITKKGKRRKLVEFSGIHHDVTSDACVFELLLIETFPMIKNFKKLEKILRYFRAKGICCCNGTIQVVRIFMQPSLLSMDYLTVIETKILQPMFERRICVHCSEKIGFEVEYFKLLREEIDRRQGWELHTLLHHLTTIQKIFDRDFLQKFLFDVIIPTFKLKKTKFLADPEENFESKVIVTSCLNIIVESVKKPEIAERFFTTESILDVRDCTLVPVMASNSCQLLKLASESVKSLSSVINGILFSNALYLIRELMEIYGEIDLPRDILFNSFTSDQDFEILDEKTVAVKEALSNMDLLLLNTIHWNILCDLVTNDVDFQLDFVANIYNNFSGNILFTIAYNALNTILLKKELKPTKTPVKSEEPPQEIFPRCDFLTPVLAPLDHKIFSYSKVIDRCYNLHEISQRFLKILEANEEFALIYRRCDKPTMFRTHVYRDVFLSDNENSTRPHRIVDEEDHFLFHHGWLNQFVVGIFEGKAIRERILQVADFAISRFVRSEDELKAIHRENTVKEITGRCGIKYLSSIARNCFDICWRLSDNISFSEYFGWFCG